MNADLRRFTPSDRSQDCPRDTIKSTGTVARAESCKVCDSVVEISSDPTVQKSQQTNRSFFNADRVCNVRVSMGR